MPTCEKDSLSTLPVIVAGAGPCGLAAALTLQQQGIAFVIVEKASRERLCSNAGSGFDMAPTAISILKERLGLPVSKVFLDYDAMHMMDMEGNKVREMGLTSNDIPVWASCNRSGLQHLLLVALFPTPKNEEGVLRCGVAVQSYEYTENDSSVKVTLSDGSTLEGRALLGCDGINSGVRKHMHRNVDDPLRFGKIICYWGKCSVKSASDLDKALQKTQTLGNTLVTGLGTGKHPGTFFVVPTTGELYWVVSIGSEEPPKETDDQTRRGGSVFDEERKRSFLETQQGRTSLITLAIENTPASGITEAGLFDRENLDFPYSDGKCVVLLGDAAHPQSPFAGQGVNMALTDAYVCAMRLCKQDTKAALEAFDTDKRRKEVNSMIAKAYSNGLGMNSTSRIMCWFMRIIIWLIPVSFILSEGEENDKSNHEMVKQLDKDFGDIE